MWARRKGCTGLFRVYRRRRQGCMGVLGCTECRLSLLLSWLCCGVSFLVSSDKQDGGPTGNSPHESVTVTA